MRTAIGLLFLGLGILLALGAAVTGTCTQFAADELLGAVPATAVYAIGLALLIAHPLRGWWQLLLMPFALVFAVQTWWSAGFFVAYHFDGVTACAWTHGPEGDVMDGREPFFTWWWLMMSLGCDAGLIWAWLRGRRR